MINIDGWKGKVQIFTTDIFTKTRRMLKRNKKKELVRCLRRKI